MIDRCVGPGGGDERAGSSARWVTHWLGRMTDAEAGREVALRALVGHVREVLHDADALRAMARLLDVLVAELDRRISALLDAILHHPRFQQLEAAWRGVRYLTDRVAEGEIRLEQDGESATIKVRLLHVSQRELYVDLSGALEVDQSEVWRKVYEEEFGVAGGAPFGLLVGDYTLGSHPQDVALLEGMAQVAAASFAPFLAAASPELFELDDYQALERTLNLTHLERPDYAHWQALRRDPNMRFVGLTLPRVLLRHPYDQAHCAPTGLYYQETVGDADPNRYLWGNAAYAFAGIVIRAFAECRWFAEIRGISETAEGGGCVVGLPRVSCPTDREGVVGRPSVEVMISDQQESLLASHGFIPLCARPNQHVAVFYANPSLYQPTRYDDMAKTQNEQLSSMLQYVLCTSRFGHHVKQLGRRWLGGTTSAQELTGRLERWIMPYVLDTDTADREFKARHPLRKAEVRVLEQSDQPGVYRLLLRLQPHYQLDRAVVRLETRIVAPESK